MMGCRARLVRGWASDLFTVRGIQACTQDRCVATKCSVDAAGVTADVYSAYVAQNYTEWNRGLCGV